MNKQAAKSYTDLYLSLVQLKWQEWGRPGWYVLLGFFVITIFVMAPLLNLNPHLILPLIGIIVVFNLFFVLIWFVILLLIAVWLGSGNALKDVNKLAAKLLLGQESLVTEQPGLVLEDLQQLKVVAEIEQSAADWRGNFINFVVIGLLFGVIAFMLEPPAFFLRWREVAQASGQTPVNVEIPAFMTALPSGVTNLFNSFSLIVAIIGLLGMLVRLARYFGDFIAHEAVNRQIQLACLEAIALLQREGLSDQTPLSLPNKRRVARLLGFRLHGGYIHTMRTPVFVDEAERAWYLLPLKRPKFSIGLWFHEWSERYFMKQRMKNKKR